MADSYIIKVWIFFEIDLTRQNIFCIKSSLSDFLEK